LHVLGGVYHRLLPFSESSQRTGDHAYANQNEHVDGGLSG
jgi:hypothetical protein